jgi:hypothetical protein
MKKLNQKTVRIVQAWEIQAKAQELLVCELNNKELKQVADALNLDSEIEATIKKVVALNGLIERNCEANFEKTYYIVYQKNYYDAENDFKKTFFAINEKDAREYLSFRPAEVSKITKVKTGTEEEILRKEENFGF